LWFEIAPWQFSDYKISSLPNYNTPLFVLAKRRFAFVSALLGGFACLVGCASIGPPLPPSLELPRPPSDLKAVRKGDKVSLTWTIPSRTMQRQTVRYLGNTNVCRSIVRAVRTIKEGPKPGSSGNTQPEPQSAGKACEMIVGAVLPSANPAGNGKKPAPKRAASFTDMILPSLQQADPYGSAIYAVEVLNTDNRGAGLSNSVSVSLVPTIAPFESFAAQVTAQGVLLSWQCPERSKAIKEVNYLFRIYRRPAYGAPEARIAELDANKCAGKLASETPNIQEAKEEAGTSFLDQTMVWETTYFYRGTVVSVLAPAGRSPIEVEGDDTPEVKIFAHDIFPPAVPTGLQAVFSGPGQQPFIDLVWNPVTDADLAGYNIYRHEEGSAPIKINSEPISTPAYRDIRVESEKTYFYSVSAVDERGNESARSEDTSESVP
jgi:hypothetical protein